MEKQNNIREILNANSVIPVVTFNSLEEVAPMVEKLLSKNIKCIEITLRTEIAFESIRYTKEHFGADISVGMGTVINLEQIEVAKNIGVDFIVSPGISAKLFAALESSKIPFIPGVSTPSEIILGMGEGYETFKFFPAHLFGGIDALKTYGQVFPNIKFCPTGGISESTFESYLALDNVLSVGGSWMVK